MMVIPRSSIWLSESVELFLLNASDVSERYVTWLNDRDVNRYLESRFMRHTLDSTRAFVVGCVDNDRKILFGIRCRWSNNRHVGNIKLEIDKRHGLGQIGILIGEKDVHGRGIATQAIKMISKIARDELGLRKLAAGCYASNKGSERAFVKAGFTVEGSRADHFLLDGRTEGCTLLGKIL